jgi:hypothetical protein
MCQSPWGLGGWGTVSFGRRGLGDSLFWSSVPGAGSWGMVLLPPPLKALKAMARPSRVTEAACRAGNSTWHRCAPRALAKRAAPFEGWRPVGLVRHLELKGDCVLGLCRGMAQQSPECGEGQWGPHGQRADAADLA